jgi:hypothetical protein
MMLVKIQIMLLSRGISKKERMLLNSTMKGAEPLSSPIKRAAKIKHIIVVAAFIIANSP